MIKALLFDMDGTITDTEKIYNKYWIQAHHECGYTDYTFEDALMQRSLGHDDSKNLWTGRYGNDYNWDEVHNRVVKYVFEDTKDGAPLKPGVHEIVDCAKSKGIKTAIVTATQYDTAIDRIKKAGLENVFDMVISASQVKRGKPNPDVYLYACEQLGYNPNDCIAVEDSPNGCNSAISAGCNTIMVPDLSEPDEELMSHLFARCDTLADIINYL